MSGMLLFHMTCVVKLSINNFVISVRIDFGILSGCMYVCMCRGAYCLIVLFVKRQWNVSSKNAKHC